MVVRVRLFAVLRERAGSSELALELPEGACVRDALALLSDLAAGLPVVMAVNREYADPDAVLHAGDELALVPPVSGGAEHTESGSAEPWARVTDEPLALESLADRVRHPGAGAVVTFSGTTRDVTRLEYEAYAEMAEPRIRAIVAEAIVSHGLCAAAAEHRVGAVALMEASVCVAASAAHREEAFAGAREIIDRIKAEAPIWKREVRPEGAEWIPGRPPRPPAPSP